MYILYLLYAPFLYIGNALCIFYKNAKNDIYYTKPMKGELIYYIRTNSGSTFEKRLKLYDKNANIGWESFYCDIIHLFRTIDEFKEIGTLPENVYEQ